MKSKIQEVQEHDWGIYVWDVPGKGIVADDEGNYLSIPSRRDDLTKMAIIRRDAIAIGRELGVEDDMRKGSPKFLQGVRQISQSEWEDEMELLESGRDPDPIAELDRDNTV